MKIIVNDKTIEVSGERVLLEELRELGYDVPSLCYDGKARHQASCMVCMVRNVANGQMLPSCSTFPIEGMQIEVDNEEVLQMRRMSLELLLSDHRADCEAPCTVVCPSHLDPAQILLYYDRGQKAEARSLLARQCGVEAEGSFVLPCARCKGGCEKACRRGTVDKGVSIREILTSLAQNESLPRAEGQSKADTDKTHFTSRLGRYTNEEKEWLKEVYTDASRCLHCACEGRDKCKLRACATKAGIKTIPYGVSTTLPVKEQIKVTGRLRFEPAKCIRCGLCVYNSEDGFTFLHRGFDMQVVIPEDSKSHVSEDLASLCPTGALFLEE